jgi:hypothetical protein
VINVLARIKTVMQNALIHARLRVMNASPVQINHANVVKMSSVAINVNA